MLVLPAPPGHCPVLNTVFLKSGKIHGQVVPIILGIDRSLDVTTAPCR